LRYIICQKLLAKESVIKHDTGYAIICQFHSLRVSVRSIRRLPESGVHDQQLSLDPFSLALRQAFDWPLVDPFDRIVLRIGSPWSLVCIEGSRGAPAVSERLLLL
jgi:hypothetical protein